MENSQTGQTGRRKSFSIAKGLCFGFCHTLKNLWLVAQMWIGGLVVAAIVTRVALEFVAAANVTAAQEIDALFSLGYNFVFTFDYQSIVSQLGYILGSAPQTFFLVFGLFMATLFGMAGMIAKAGRLLLPLGTIVSFIIASVMFVATGYVGYYTVGRLILFWMAKYAFYPQVLATKNVGPVEAFRKSDMVVEGALKWQMLFFTLLSGLLMGAGNIVYCMWFLLLMPVLVFMQTQVYNTLKK